MTNNNSKITGFDPVSKSKTSRGKIDLNKVLKFIKGENNSYVTLINAARQSGKYNTDKKYNLYSFGKKMKVNYYDFIKSTKIPSVNFMLQLEKGRRRRIAEIKNEDLSGYMYFDIDDVKIDVDIDELAKVIFSFDQVKACWKSMSYEGLGFIVKVDGLSKEDFLYTWTDIKKFFETEASEKLKTEFPKLCFEHNQNVTKDNNLVSDVFFTLDVATKDVTRLNVLSYDPNIKIRDDKNVNAFKAIGRKEYEEKYPDANETFLTKNRKRKDISIEVDKNALQTPTQVESLHIESIFKNLYNDPSRWNENRLSYNFHRDFYAATNKQGIKLEKAFSWCLEKKKSDDNCALFDYRDPDEVLSTIGEKIYDQYEAQFGSAIHENSNYDDYEIKDINVPFDGTYRDAKIFMDFVYYDVCNKKKLNLETIYNFAKTVKEKGISYNHMMSFLVERNIKEVVMQKARETYANTFIAFGIILEEKKEISKKKLDKLTSYMKRKGRVPKKVSHSAQVPAYVTNNLNFDEKNLSSDIFIFTKRCIQQNVSTYDGWKFLSKIEIVNDNIKGCNAIYEHVMKMYAFTQGTIFVKQETKPYTNKQQYSAVHKINEDQYLSDLSLKLPKRAVLYADTGAGKTTWALSKNSPKCIFLVPTTALAEGASANKKGVRAYHGKKKKYTLDDKIVCTYSSFRSLIADITKKGGDPYSYKLYIDEGHNIITSAQENFRKSEMDYMIKMLKNFNDVVILTGTWFENIIPELQEFSIIRVEKKRKFKYQYIDYIDRHVAIEKMCVKNKLNVIYLQSKKTESSLGTYKEYFKMKGWDEQRMLFVNADTKGDVYTKRIIKKKEVPSHIEILFITSFAAEGLDIYNKNVASLHFASQEHPVMMQQIVNRFRKTVPEMIYLYDNLKKTDNVVDFTSRIEEQEGFAKSITDVLQLCLNSDNYRHLNDVFNRQFYTVSDNAELKPDYLAIANSVYNKEKGYANNNFEYMQSALAYYGWSFVSRKAIEQKAEKHIEKSLKVFRQVEKDKIITEKQKIIEYIHDNENLNDVKAFVERPPEVIAESSSMPDFEFAVRHKILNLANYIKFESAIEIVKNWIFNMNASPLHWKRLMKSFEIMKRIHYGYYEKAACISNNFYKNLKNEIQTAQDMLRSKKKYFDYQIIDLVNRFRRGAEDIIPEVSTKEEAFDVLSRYIYLDKTVDKAKKVRTVFKGVKVYNEESYLIKSLYNFAKYHLKSGEKFTKIDVAKFIANKKNKCIFGQEDEKLFGTTHDKALEILKMICDVDSEDRGKTYNVVGMFSAFLNNIKWRDDIKSLYDERLVELKF